MSAVIKFSPTMLSARPKTDKQFSSGELSRYINEKAMRYISSVVLVFGFLSVAHADDLPNLVCQELGNDTILNGTFEHLGESKIKEVYRFSGGKLFISSQAIEGELIGVVARMKGLKYQAGDKTIVFSDVRYLEATTVEHGTMFIRISKLRCSKT